MVYVNHFFLDGTRIFHEMCAHSHYSSGMICDEKSLATSVQAIENISLDPFLPSTAVEVDIALSTLSSTTC